MTTRTWAADLVAHASAELTAAGVEHAAEPDVSRAPSALAAGHLVLTVRPPTLEVPSWDEVEATWEIVLIAGPAADAWAAWERLDEALAALLRPLAVESVRPDAFTDTQGASYAAQVLTTTSHHTL